MRAIYERATRLALNLVAPYDAGVGGPPATSVWPYLRSHLRPLRWVIGLSLAMTILAASIEIWLISYAGRLIDMLIDSTPYAIWRDHAGSLMFAAFMLTILRPFIQFLRHAVNDIGLDCNGASLFRFRAHAHLTQQSVGWFQDDLTGRTASRLVLMGNYATAVIFQSLNAVAFGTVYNRHRGVHVRGRRALGPAVAGLGCDLCWADGLDRTTCRERDGGVHGC